MELQESAMMQQDTAAEVQSQTATFCVTGARKLAAACLNLEDLLDINAALLVPGLAVAVCLGCSRHSCTALSPPQHIGGNTASQ